MREYEVYEAVRKATIRAESAGFVVTWASCGWALDRGERTWFGNTSAEMMQFLDGYESTPGTPDIIDDDVQWVVNDIGELGVKIGDRFFWLYKGYSLVYTKGKHDDGTPMKWRPVGKREFGEVCHPVDYYDKRHNEQGRYSEQFADVSWQDLPAMPAYTNGYERNHKGATRPEPKS
jgi:hypothetical protein